MADIRIKDLTTTASSSASDDFIAIDGTTNGTRKLNAFSPTFGGNATVTGTLTVNGGATTINGNASGTTSYARLQNNGSSIALLGSRAAIDSGTATDVGLFVYGANELSFWTNSTRSAWISSGGVFNTVAGAAVGGTLSVASTTASTSTSSGALVVSGGVGVAGAMNVGSQLKVTNSSIPDLWLQNTSGATSAYRNILIRQNSDDTFKFLSTSDAGVLSKDNIITGNNATGAIGIGVAPGSGTSSLTIAGNLAVSGTQNTFGLPSSASSLGTNSTMTFELTSNTSLKIFVRGSDGTTRSTTLTLA